MDLGTTLVLAVGLAMDAFAVSLGVGTIPQTSHFRARFRLSFHFGLFQALMPILGWFLGSRLAWLISTYDHWVAVILLSYVGIKMIRASLNPREEAYTEDPSRGRMLLALTIATSIDAFAVGLSLAMLNVQILNPAIIIGLVTVLLSVIGLIIGNRMGKEFGKRVEAFGGVLLIAIGFKILLGI
jgi:putative Mn2+ efflux pump MntP